ncbi:unnamed protein product [Schistosoma spindalis]|nr:unnamed protein product [Schistosoma spindale]
MIFEKLQNIEPLKLLNIESSNSLNIESSNPLNIESLNIESWNTFNIESLNTLNIESLNSSNIEPLNALSIEQLKTLNIEPLNSLIIESSNIEPLTSLNIELLNLLNIEPLKLLNIELIISSIIIHLIVFMFCIKFKTNPHPPPHSPPSPPPPHHHHHHYKLSLNKLNEIDKNEKFSLIKKNSKNVLRNHKLLCHCREDQLSDKHFTVIDSNSISSSENKTSSKCIKSNEFNENQLTLLHNHQLSNSLHNNNNNNNNNNSLPIKLSNNLDLNQSNPISIKTLTTKINLNENHHHHHHHNQHHHHHHQQQQQSLPFTVWFIKMAKKLLYWKNTFMNIHLSSKSSNYCHIINEIPIDEYHNTINVNRIDNDHLNKITIQKRLSDKGTFGFNIQHIKQKANSLKEQSRKGKVYHGYSIWTDSKSVIQTFSNRISPYSTTYYHLSPYRQYDSQSDLFDPIYSAIQYPLKDTLQSTHSSLWDHSSVSVHQPYGKDRLLVKNIWTSQDSIVSDAHVYCELIELKSTKTHYPTNKKLDCRSFYKDYSTCSLPSYDNQYNQDVISDKYCNEQPPKLPHRNYGESTLNMVANLRLWATRNKQKILKNLYKINKLHKNVYSMSDMTWRLKKKRHFYDLPLDKRKNYTEQSSLRTSFQYHKHNNLGSRNFIEKPKDYDELTSRNTRSTFSETDIVSLENINSFNIWSSQQPKDPISSACYSNEAFSLETNIQLTKQSTNFNDRCNNLRHIDSESDITELSPIYKRNKSPRSKPLKLNPSLYPYPSLTSTSFTPLYHIYIPNQCRHHSYMNDVHLQCHQNNTIHSHISNRMLTEEIPYYTTTTTTATTTTTTTTTSPYLCMPPLMERSMEDDEYHLYK